MICTFSTLLSVRLVSPERCKVFTDIINRVLLLAHLFYGLHLCPVEDVALLHLRAGINILFIIFV